PLGGDELELRLGVDEPGNEPRARDAIDVDPLPGHPRGAAGRLGGMSWWWDLRLPRAQPRLEPRDLFVGRPAARGPEEVDGDDVGEASPPPATISRLCHSKSSTVSSERGRTYTEFLIATAPRRCNLRPTLTRK